jgi:hypothetical protein
VHPEAPLPASATAGLKREAARPVQHSQRLGAQTSEAEENSGKVGPKRISKSNSHATAQPRQSDDYAHPATAARHNFVTDDHRTRIASIKMDR